MTALARHRLIRPALLEELITGAQDGVLRERLSEAWAVCRRRASEPDPPA